MKISFLRPSVALIPAALLLALIGLTPLVGCKKSAETSTQQKAAAADPMRVKVPAELLRSITIGTAEHQQVTATQKAAARVATDARSVARIGSPVDGRITRVLVFEGQHVRQGQALAMLHSNNLSDTQFAFVKACSQQHLAEQSADRARQLVQADVIGRAELQKREAEVLQSSTEVAALRAQLHGLGMSESAIRTLETSRKLTSEYPILATISGTVYARNVTIGQVVQTADIAFEIADLSRLWLVAEVPEIHASSLEVGKTVQATIPATPSDPITGKLSFVSPIVNPETRTVQARMDLPNAKGIFKPDMLASMTFESRPENRLTLPATAVVREDNRDFIFLQTANDEFILHPVELGPEVNERRVVLSGITGNEKIVLNGAFHLNNKRKQDQIKGGE